MFGQIPGITFQKNGSLDDRGQRQLQAALTKLFDVPLSDGNLLSVTFPSGANTDLRVEHKLMRPVNGYIPVSLSAAGIIYTSPTVVNTPDAVVILRCSVGSVAAKLWIF